MENSSDKSFSGISRRGLIKTGLVVTGGALLPVSCTVPTNSSSVQTSSSNQQLTSRRKLGNNLEVSMIDLAVQNMSRTYQTTIPTRTEMFNIIRTVYSGPY